MSKRRFFPILDPLKMGWAGLCSWRRFSATRIKRPQQNERFFVFFGARRRRVGASFAHRALYSRSGTLVGQATRVEPAEPNLWSFTLQSDLPPTLQADAPTYQTSRNLRPSLRPPEVRGREKKCQNYKVLLQINFGPFLNNFSRFLAALGKQKHCKIHCFCPFRIKTA